MSELISIPMSAEDVATLAATYPPNDWAKVQYDGTNLRVPAELYSSISGTDLPSARMSNLIAYANATQWAKATGGYETTVNGETVRFSTTSESMSLMTGKVVRLQQSDPPATVKWQTGPDTFVTIADVVFQAIAVAVADYVQSTFDKLQTVVAGIKDGTITTTAQVDEGLA